MPESNLLEMTLSATEAPQGHDVSQSQSQSESQASSLIDPFNCCTSCVAHELLAGEDIPV